HTPRCFATTRRGEADRRAGHRSVADRLQQHPLPPPAVELGVEDLLPRPKVEASLGDREDDLMRHELTLQVRVRIVLTVVVAVLRNRLVRCEALEPLVDVLE